jgi:EAL domain-containing protein (putative c-di-GMP-specific phosphodiesterase class I)
VTAALEASGAAANRLQIEITETVLMQNTFANLQSLTKLRELGVQIALDDFGTGYSSLSYLRTFPFDKIKIDRSFIQDLANGVEPYAIVNAVAGLANSLSITSTAEGVETQEQLDTLQAIGCAEMQGYLFSAPKTAKDVAKFLVEHAAKAATTAA